MSNIVCAVEAGTLFAYGTVCLAAGLMGIGDRSHVWITIALFAGAAVCFLRAVTVHAHEDTGRTGHNSHRHKGNEKQQTYSGIRKFETFDLRKEWEIENQTQKTD